MNRKPDTIADRARRFAEDLRRARIEGRIRPEDPLAGKLIAAKLNRFYGWDLRGDAAVRELVNYARTIEQPIAATKEGYFWATNSAELKETIADLKSRIACIGAALAGLERCQRRMRQVEANFQAQPETEDK